MAKNHRKQSKRIPLKRKHSIIKKVSEHNRKLRRLSKSIKKKPRKDPGIPNSMPFKEEILREVALKKQQKKEEELRRKEELKAARLARKETPKDLKELCEDATARGELHEETKNPEDVEPEEQIYQSGATARKYYFKEFKKVLLGADVILEVLDARDPMSCRCPDVEQEVVSSGKKLVLVLNKIDLIPKQNAVDWIKFLRRDFPTVPFKASTQKQKSALGSYKLKFTKTTTEILRNSRSFGIDYLLKLIGNYTRNNGMKLAITIGIIGLPNVGKSSLINSLKREKACNIGAYPGITKSMQPVILDRKVKLLDSPGIIMQKDVDMNSLVLRNCVPQETVKDPVAVINQMLKKVKGNQLCYQYKLPVCTSADQLLSTLAKKRGLLRKGGVPNIGKAGKLLINDWNNGVIRYYTQVPQVDQSMDLNTNASAEIISEFSEEFDIDALLNAADGSTPANVQSLMDDVFVPVEPEGQLSCVNETLLEQETLLESQEIEKMESKLEKANPKSVRFGQKMVKTLVNDDGDMEFESASDPENEIETDFSKTAFNPSGDKILTYNKRMKLHLKHLKKMKRKTTRADSKLAEAAENMMDIDSSSKAEEYDFKEHFDMPSK